MKINPTFFLQTPLDDIIDNLEINVSSFPLFTDTILISWKVYGPNTNKEGIMNLPKSVIDQWGTDDSIVKNYVLQQLNLTEDTTSDT